MIALFGSLLYWILLNLRWHTCQWVCNVSAGDLGIYHRLGLREQPSLCFIYGVSLWALQLNGGENFLNLSASSGRHCRWVTWVNLSCSRNDSRQAWEGSVDWCTCGSTSSRPFVEFGLGSSAACSRSAANGIGMCPVGSLICQLLFLWEHLGFCSVGVFVFCFGAFILNSANNCCLFTSLHWKVDWLV